MIIMWTIKLKLKFIISMHDNLYFIYMKYLILIDWLENLIRIFNIYY